MNHRYLVVHTWSASLKSIVLMASPAFRSKLQPSWKMWNNCRSRNDDAIFRCLVKERLASAWKHNHKYTMTVYTHSSEGLGGYFKQWIENIWQAINWVVYAKVMQLHCVSYRDISWIPQDRGWILLRNRFLSKQPRPSGTHYPSA